MSSREIESMSPYERQLYQIQQNLTNLKKHGERSNQNEFAVLGPGINAQDYSSRETTQRRMITESFSVAQDEQAKLQNRDNQWNAYMQTAKMLRK